MKCPACDHELTEMKFGGVTVDACNGGCAGIWFDAFELQKVDEHKEVPGEHLLRIQRDPALKVDLSRRRECPRCDGVKLKRHFFSAKKRVEVDQCPSCGGYWLDDGELEKIRQEKHVTAKVAEASGKGLSMEAIRFLYRQKLAEKP
ncbi:MAG TPA: zf-TFIIB domain-containing protein [Verrucomicrobiota bacterium]|nr:zf-TFIIB domain-containing protein [Verrucomicrobiota bacterium]